MTTNGCERCECAKTFVDKQLPDAAGVLLSSQIKTIDQQWAMTKALTTDILENWKQAECQCAELEKENTALREKLIATGNADGDTITTMGRMVLLCQLMRGLLAHTCASSMANYKSPYDHTVGIMKEFGWKAYGPVDWTDPVTGGYTLYWNAIAIQITRLLEEMKDIVK